MLLEDEVGMCCQEQQKVTKVVIGSLRTCGHAHAHAMWHEQESQYCRELVIRGCSDIVHWWLDHRLELPTISDPARNTFCVMASSADNLRVFRMDGHVVNSRRANLNSLSVNDMLFFNIALKAEKEVFKVDYEVSHFHFTLFFKRFCWLWNEPLNKLLLATKHVAWVFSGFPWQVQTWNENSAGGEHVQLRRLRVGSGQKSQSAQDSSAFTSR